MAMAWWLRGPAAGMISWLADDEIDGHVAAGNCQRFDCGGWNFRPPQFGQPLSPVPLRRRIEQGSFDHPAVIPQAGSTYETRVMAAERPKRGRGRPRKQQDGEG